MESITPADLGTKLRELEAEFDRARKKREEWEAKEAEVRRRLEAVRLTAQEFGIEPAARRSSRPGSTNETIADQVRQHIEALEPGTLFRTDEVFATIGNGSMSAVSRALIRLARAGELEVMERGKGPHPSLYRVPGEPQADARGDEDDDVPF